MSRQHINQKQNSMKKTKKSHQPPRAPEAGAELPLGTGKGVAPLNIPALSKAAGKYQHAKDKRCQASPAEIAAKRDLEALLHKHKADLPTTKDGSPFYRYEERDYVLEEKMKIRAAGVEDSEE